MRTVVWGTVLAFSCIVLTAVVVGGGDPIVYHEVVVPAPRIIEREVPGEVRFVDKIKFVYVDAGVTATAPAGATLAVQLFCAPTVALVLGDTTSALPRQEVIRSVVAGHSLIPLRRDPLLVTSMDSYGDLFARDYKVRPGFGVGSGDQIVVRYSRWALLGELAEGLLWHGGFSLVEVLVGIR